MEIESIRCSYNHKVAIPIRISIIIKHTNLDAFQNKGLRKVLGLKHAYFSRIKNQQDIATANQETKPNKHKEINKISKKLKQRQITLYSEPQKMMK